MASASKDETVIIWNMEKIKQNLNKSLNVNQQDYIVTMIDDHEHVIDAIKFAPEAARKTIQAADYNKIKPEANQSVNDPDTTGEYSRVADSELEESKRQDETDASILDQNRMTTKEKVHKLKEDLKKRKAMLRGEIEQEVKQEGANAEEEIQIDTSKQEAMLEVQQGELKEYIATGARDKKIRIFEVKSGFCLLTLVGHDNWVTDLLFHPNGKYLISAADDKSIRIWDLAYGRCYRKIYNAHDHFITCFDMKGKYAASGSVDTCVKIWSCR